MTDAAHAPVAARLRAAGIRDDAARGKARVYARCIAALFRQAPRG